MFSAAALITQRIRAKLKARQKTGTKVRRSDRLALAGSPEFRLAQEKVYGATRQGSESEPLPDWLPPAVREWLRGNFLPYQIRWILDDSAFALCLKGRQLGFTDASAARCLIQALLRRRPQVVLSAAEKNAQELLDAVRRHARFLSAIGMPNAARFRVDNTSELAWAHGGSVTALAANPRTARSFHGDVYFDELAYYDDADAMWAAAAPMATRGDWRIRVISTPNGATGKFYELCTAANDNALGPSWTFHRVSLDDAERDGLQIDRARLLALVAGDERAFAEAYLLRFLDADFQYFPTTLVDAARDWTGRTPELDDAVYFAGLDVGRFQDLTVLTILAVKDGVAWVVAQLTAKRTAFKAQRAMIEKAREAFAWSKLAIDATGLGTQLAEELVEAFGENEVIPVVFTAPAKQDLATGALRWLRDGSVRFPRGAGGKRLHAEVVAVRRKVTASGNVIFESPRTKAGHGDHAWSLFLALKAAANAAVPRGVGSNPLMAVA